MSLTGRVSYPVFLSHLLTSLTQSHPRPDLDDTPRERLLQHEKRPYLESFEHYDSPPTGIEGTRHPVTGSTNPNYTVENRLRSRSVTRSITEK